MTLIRISIFTLLLSLQLLSAALAQEPIKGIVWNPPARFERAVEDLTEMKSLGIEAVRTSLIKDERLLELSDSLELTLYQDLPFEYLSSADLITSTETAKKILEEALQIANRHSSARHFGLATFSNTSTAASCTFLEELVNSARSRFGNQFSFYYTTFFIEDERCTSSVDLVLLNVLDDQNFSAKTENWSLAHPNTPLGFANIGTWIQTVASEETAMSGYLQENSVEYQARFIEHTLNTLLKKEPTPPVEVLFIYRWRDSRLPYPSPAHNLSQPYRHTYGLHTSNNHARPSYEVTKGFYLKNQDVFAFTAGEPVPTQNHWITLFIWINILLLSIAYAYFPRFRLMARRYFTAHGFFREAIREGRELLIGPNILIFGVISSAFGLTLIVILDAFRKNEAFSLVLRWLPESVSFTVVALLAQPILLFIVLSGSYGLLLSFWTSALSAISTRSRWTLLPGQSFMLVLWSQWPLLLAMVGAGVVNAMTQPQITQSAFFLAVTLLAFIALGMLFTLRDFWHISKANPALVTLSLVINPVILVTITTGYYCFKYSDRFIFAFDVAARAY